VTRWDSIPFNKECSPADKAEEFDRQMAENGGPTPEELEEQAKEGNRC
jgi:hypothetical protein